TPAFVDLIDLSAPTNSPPATTPSTAAAEAVLFISSTQPLLCDDIMILDNSAWYVSGEESPWVVKQRGFKILIERDGWFRITLDTVDKIRTGWTLEDSSFMRVTLSSTGK